MKNISIMALRFDNTTIRRKNPINRNNKFFSDDDLSLEASFAEEYIEQDANQTVILYEVDLDKTQVNDIYKEAKKDGIRFKTPVELPVVYEIADAELKSYDNKVVKGYYAKTGKLKFSVLLKTLEEYECDIKRGDYIGIQIDSQHVEYFSVTNDGRVGTTSNKNTIYGKTPWYRVIEAASVDSNEFNA